MSPRELYICFSHWLNRTYFSILLCLKYTICFPICLEHAWRFYRNLNVDIFLLHFNIRYKQTISIFKILYTSCNTIKVLLPLLLVNKLMLKPTRRLCLLRSYCSIGSFDHSVLILVSTHLEFSDFLHKNEGTQMTYHVDVWKVLLLLGATFEEVLGFAWLVPAWMMLDHCIHVCLSQWLWFR